MCTGGQKLPKGDDKENEDVTPKIDVPEFYTELSGLTNTPDKPEAFKLVQHSTVPIREPVFASLPKACHKNSVRLFREVLMYGGDLVGTGNDAEKSAGSTELAGHIVALILDPGIVTMRTEAFMQLIKQVYIAPQQNLRHYMNLFVCYATFVRLLDNRLKTFIKKWCKHLVKMSEFQPYQRQLDFIEDCLNLPTAHSLFVKEIDCCKWAIDHLNPNSSFFDSSIEEQMTFQKGKLALAKNVPYCLYTLTMSILSTANANISSIFREATESENVTRLKISIDKFEETTTNVPNAREHAYLLQNYLRSSKIVQPETLNKIFEAMDKGSKDGKEISNESKDEIFKIVNSLPESSLNFIIYFIYFIKVKLLVQPTETTVNTTIQLFAPVLFKVEPNTSTNVQTSDAARSNTYEKPARLFHLLYDEWDISKGEAMF